jgi:thiol-disulfide isomerase/thioredoxin
VALLFGLLSCNEGNKDKVVSSIEKDRPIDKIRLKDLDGTPINLEKYQGETVFINFWATWCKPCLKEMPSIEKAQHILQNENVVFLLASAETIEEIGTFRKLNTYPFNYVQIQNSEELSIDGLPTTFIFDKEGKLVFSESGYRKWDDKGNIDTILKIINTNE